MPMGQMPVGEQHTIDQNSIQIGYTRAGLPECVVSTMSGPPQETVHDRTQRHTPNPRIEIKIPYPAGNRTRAAGLEARDSTDHATLTNGFLISI